ncbi:MAG TPA: hypothetical protein ENK50_03480, partial [Sedimenticola sp.]|nr:hypothetical protein [Sedimenticola sp.]
MTRRLVVAGLLVALGAALAFQLRLETRLTVFFLGPGAEMDLVSRLQQSHFARRYLLLIEPARAGAPVTALSRRLRARLAQVAGVARVWSLTEPPVAVLDLLQRYAAHAEVIYSLDPAREAPALFDPDRLPERAERLKQAL